MIEEAKEAIRNSSETSSVYIGCDSLVFKRKGKSFAKYSTVVVIHINSKHGCKIFHKTDTLPEYGNLKQRLMNEVYYAAEVALQVVEVIGKRKMEVHLDLNSDASEKSHIAVKEALGYIRGLGFDAKIKPDSFAATHVGDHVVRH